MLVSNNVLRIALRNCSQLRSWYVVTLGPKGTEVPLLVTLGCELSCSPPSAHQVHPHFPAQKTRPQGRPLWPISACHLLAWPPPSSYPSPAVHVCLPQGTPVLPPPAVSILPSV